MRVIRKFLSIVIYLYIKTAKLLVLEFMHNGEY